MTTTRGIKKQTDALTRQTVADFWRRISRMVLPPASVLDLRGT
eukprot:CAMPEP_0204330310 /NCGR_PEP_ID=MMETSP0469-20131031/14825_1 /ASSEMBLY_ACC=CAM_ASM_000384 /TAXON_ID=2969 /ORGANISM="Oxyrrhis marina" /LENGTH=42 /DNA_ID= /DNA_START= /DNA_END= /DNA_ORIENTATION=